MSPRRLLGALLAVLALAVAGLALGTGAAAGQDAPEAGGAKTAITGEEAVNDLADCISASKHLAVVFLIDQSGSLGKSDHDARRVDAAKAALDSFVSLTEGGRGERAQVDATFAAFSNDYFPVRDWTRVDGDTQPGLVKTLETFRKRNQGTDTDFVNALAGANDALTEKSAEIQATGEPAPCKAIVLFTDGQYDIGVRDKSNVDRLGDTKPYAPDISLSDEAGVLLAENAGRKALCDEGGVADRFRDGDVTLLTIALTGSALAEKQDFLTAVSTGESGAVKCGRSVSRPPGAYVSADDVDSLVASFDEVATRVAGGTPDVDEADQKLVLCGAEPCPGGTRTIRVDNSVRRFRILALAPQPGMVVQIDSPSASATIDATTTTTIGTAPVRARSIAGRGYSIDVDRPAKDADWTGEWKVYLLDPTGKQEGKPVTFTSYVFTDVGIDFTEGKAPDLVRGTKATVSASLVVPKGSSTQLSAASVVLRLDDPITGKSTNVKLEGPPNGPYRADYTMPPTYRSNSATATLELDGTTTTDAAVVARSAPRQVLVKRPEGSIQFAPAALSLPSIEGTGSSTADLIVLGGAKDGCVWFGPEKANAPDGAGDIAVTYNGESAVGEDSCIEVKAAETLYVTVEVSPQHRATGAVRGVLEVHERSQGTKATVTNVQYSLDLTAGIDQGRRLLLAAVLLAGGLLIPMLLLLLINAITARFQDMEAVRGASIPVRIDGKRVWRLENGRWTGFVLRDADFESLSEAGDARQFTFGGIVFRARPARNPFGASVALAAPEGGAERLKGGVGSRVELDLGLIGCWVFLLDPDKTRRAGRRDVAEGSLIAFIAEGEAGPQIARMNPDLDRRLPTVAIELATLVREAPVHPTKPPKESRRAKHDGAEAGSAEDVEPADAEPLADAESSDAPVEPADSGTGPEAVDDGGAEAAPAAPAGFTGVAAPAAPSPPPAADAAPDEEPGAGAEPDEPDSGSAPLGFTGGPR